VRLGFIVAAIIGLGVAAYLIFHIGIGAIFAAAASVGWGGFGLICLAGLALFVILGPAWFILIPARFRPRLATFIWGRGVRDSASEVLPFSHVGGIVIGARAVVLRGVSAPLAYASTIVDVTTEMVAQIAYILVGIAILVARVPKSASSEWLANTAGIATLVGTLGVIAFVVAQKRGFSYAEKIAARMLPNVAAKAAAMHEAMEAIHASPPKLFLSVCIHVFAWFAGAAATYLAIRLMGIHVAFASIVSIEALLCAVRSAAIVVPNALGVQEATYALLMPFFGLAAPIGLALSLLKRARDIAIGIPILLVWQASEGGRAFARTLAAETQIEDKAAP
jgi:putative membrane protein